MQLTVQEDEWNLSAACPTVLVQWTVEVVHDVGGMHLQKALEDSAMVVFAQNGFQFAELPMTELP